MQVATEAFNPGNPEFEGFDVIQTIEAGNG